MLPAAQEFIFRTREKHQLEFRKKERFFFNSKKKKKKNCFSLKFQRFDLFQSKRFPPLGLSKFPSSSALLTANELSNLQIFEGRQYQLSDFETLFSLLSKSEPYSRYCGLIGLRKLFIENDENDDFFENSKSFSDFLRIILNLASYQNDLYAQYESLWILSNLTVYKGDLIGFLVDQGVLLILNQNIDHENEKIRELSIWGLANIIAEQQTYRDCLINAGIVGRLVKVLRKCGKECKEIVIWAISNIFKMKPLLEWELFLQIYDEFLIVIKEETTPSENMISALSLVYIYTSNKKNKGLKFFIFNRNIWK